MSMPLDYTDSVVGSIDGSSFHSLKRVLFIFGISSNYDDYI
jgi:hypothetical protein